MLGDIVSKKRRGRVLKHEAYAYNVHLTLITSFTRYMACLAPSQPLPLLQANKKTHFLVHSRAVAS